MLLNIFDSRWVFIIHKPQRRKFIEHSLGSINTTSSVKVQIVRAEFAIAHINDMEVLVFLCQLKNSLLHLCIVLSTAAIHGSCDEWECCITFNSSLADKI